MADETVEMETSSDVEMTNEPSNPEALAEQKKIEANQLYAAEQYRLALEEYSRVIELCPNVAKHYGNRAACYMMLSEYQSALDDAKKCIELNPDFSKGYTRVIKCCLVLGKIIEAETFLNKKALIDPTSESLVNERHDLENVKRYLREAESAYAAKDFRKVVYYMSRCADISPACPRFKLTKAECLALLGRYQEAQKLANDVLLKDRRNADAIYIRGMCLYYQDNERAFTYFQNVLRLAPDHTKALEIYKKAKQLKQKKLDGGVAFKMGRYQEAYNLYSEALNIDPFNKAVNSKLHFNKATSAAKLGKLNESISECTEALNLDDGYLKAILRRATCYMELQNYEEAVRDYEQACKIDKSRENRRLLHEAKEALRKSMRKDYYKILGVSKTASTDDIKKAYKKKALVHHPDRHANASDTEKKVEEKKFKEIGEAYTILSDPKKRSCYDDGQSFNGVNPAASEYDTFEAFFNGYGKDRGTFQFQSSGFPGFTF